MSDDLRLLKITQEDKEVELYIKKPSIDDLENADLEKVLTFQKWEKKGLPLKAEWEQFLKKKGLWSEKIEEEVKTLQKELSDKIAQLDEGGIPLDDAKKIALDINDLRNKLVFKLMDKKNFVMETADGKAEQAYLDYLVSACVVYNEDRSKKYFKDYQDYRSRKNDPDVFIVTQRYAEIMYDSVFDEKRLPENEFLIEFGFMNDDLRLINEDGHLVDIDGNLINEEGQRVEVVDGKDVVVEQKTRKPFLDKEGNPIK